MISKMKRLAILCASVAAFAMTTPAMAAKIFVLDGVKLQDGGTLTGSFTTNDSLTQLEAINITASANSSIYGNFTQFTYDNLSQVDWMVLPTQGFRIQVSSLQELRLDFFPLTVPTANILGTSYEKQAGTAARAVTAGHVVLADTPAVPEPASWAMMIAGFGMIGGALRIRSRKVTFA